MTHWHHADAVTDSAKERFAWRYTDEGERNHLDVGNDPMEVAKLIAHWTGEDAATYLRDNGMEFETQAVVKVMTDDDGKVFYRLTFVLIDEEN